MCAPMEITQTVKNKLSESSSMLAPGFRFHPTDEELVRYYLRRKVCGKGFRVDAISDIDIYKAEPWDLPSFSKLQTRDLEWYFFSVLDKKYGNGSKTNRATERGYWKTTGKDREVYHKSQVIGMKKTLVYHNGRAPKGLRTNWVMHEYRLTDSDLGRAGIAQDGFVLCRVFQKSGSGPKNGERYGAPFVEEEWEDDDLALVPKIETAEIIDFDADGYLDGHDLEQILGANEQEGFGEETINNSGELLLNASELQPIPFKDDNFANFPASSDTSLKVVKHEFIGETSQSANSDYLDFLLDEPFFDCNDHTFGSGFVEDDSVPINPSALGMLDEYLTFNDNTGNFEFDQPSVALERDHDHVMLPLDMVLHQEPKDGSQQPYFPSEQLFDNDNDAAAAPDSDKLDSSAIHDSDLLNPFVKYSTKMLASLPTSPAFASDLTSKDAVALRLNSLSQSSTSSHVAAGMIQIRDNYGTNQFINKDHNLNIVISLGFSTVHDGSATVESSLWIHPGKIISTISRSSFSSPFFWVLLLSISFKLGIWISAKGNSQLI